MGKTILVVDDEKDVADLVQNLLERKGYTVLTANDGADGLKKAEAIKPDLILLDVMMPKLSGYDVVKALKRHEAMKNIPIIMLTAKALSYEAFKKEGVTDYLLKPFLPAELVEKIGEFFAK